MITRAKQHICISIGLIILASLIGSCVYANQDTDTLLINEILRKAKNKYTNDPEKSDSLAHIALKLSQKLKYKKGEARANKIIADIFRISNHNFTAIEYYQKSLAFFEKHDPFQTMEIYQWLGLSLAFEAFYDSGKVYIEKSIKLADSLQSIESKAQSFLNLARLYRIMGHLNKSLDKCLKALSLTDSLQDADLTWKIKNFTGFVYLQNNKHKEAAELLNENIMSYKNYMHMPEEVYRLFYYNSALDLFFKNFERTIYYQNIALKITDSIPNRNLAEYFIAMSHEALSKAYMQMARFDSAKHHLSLAINNKEYGLDLHAKANIYYSIGDVFFELHQSDSAMFYFKKSATLHQKNQNYTKLQIANLGIGKTYFQVNNHKMAKRYLYKSIKNQTNDNNIEVLAQAWQLLSEIYEQEGDYIKAYNYHKKYKNASDELFSNEKVKNITRLELEYTFTDKQKQLEHLREQEKIAFEAKLKQNKTTRNFAGIGFVLSIIIAAFAYKNYKIKKKANQEKETLLREIHHRVKNNLQIISSMLNLQGNYLTDKKAILAISESMGRVKSMALIHQMLYQHERFSSIDMHEYIVQLSHAISSSFESQKKDIRLIFNLERLMIDIDTAIPIGLIVNELITNAFKYAFINHSGGTIDIALNKIEEDTFCLKIADNGIGIKNANAQKNTNTFGLNMVDVLTRQIKGKLIRDNKIGTSYLLKFKEVNKTTKK
jgi:two-component sensor histidine kinase